MIGVYHYMHSLGWKLWVEGQERAGEVVRYADEEFHELHESIDRVADDLTDRLEAHDFPLA